MPSTNGKIPARASIFPAHGASSPPENPEAQDRPSPKRRSILFTQEPTASSPLRSLDDLHHFACRPRRAHAIPLKFFSFQFPVYNFSVPSRRHHTKPALNLGPWSFLGHWHPGPWSFPITHAAAPPPDSSSPPAAPDKSQTQSPSAPRSRTPESATTP